MKTQRFAHLGGRPVGWRWRPGIGRLRPMLRTCFRALVLPLWAVWLSLAAIERPMSVACQMAGAGATAPATPAMSGAAGMQHRTHHAPTTAAVTNCCGCLGDCGTAPMTTIPGGGTVVAVCSTPLLRRVAEPLQQLPPVTGTDLALPYPNAPPISALIS